jgi:hypothetical protein
MKVISTQKQVITLRFNNEGIQYSYACYYLSEWKAKKGVKTTTTINLPNHNPTKILKKSRHKISKIKHNSKTIGLLKKTYQRWFSCSSDHFELWYASRIASQHGVIESESFGF